MIIYEELHWCLLLLPVELLVDVTPVKKVTLGGTLFALKLKFIETCLVTYQMKEHKDVHHLHLVVGQYL